MSYKQRLLRPFIMIILIYCLWLVSGAADSQKLAGAKDQSSFQGKIYIPIIASQLDLVDGVIPVELKCQNAELSAPNAVEKLSCVIKNNTHKPISAGAVYTSMTVEKDGMTSVTSSYGTFDTFMHPDFREDHKDNLILPGGEYPYNDLPVSYDDSNAIKSIEIKIDYVEFADNTALGTNQAGSRIIADTRKGAAKYKNWLAQKYKESGGSLEALVALVENNQPLPKELGFQTGPEEHGARMYRNYALRTYKTKGAERLVKFLKETKTSANE